MCVLHLEGLQDELPGIQDIQASLHQQKLVIEFDDQLISEEMILKNIEEKGYRVKR
jgi:copper chaperone CopZ